MEQSITEPINMLHTLLECGIMYNPFRCITTFHETTSNQAITPYPSRVNTPDYSWLVPLMILS